MTVAVNSAPGSERGAVMGTFTAFFDLSFGGGLLTLGFVSHAFGYNGAFLVASGVAFAGLLMLVFAPPRVPERAEITQVVEVEPPGE
jgi:MFS family permease